MGQGVVTRSLETQLFRSQRILKPSTLPQFHEIHYMILTLREEEDKTIKAINPAESLPNRPTPPKPIKFQLATPKPEILRAGLPKVELDKRDSVLKPATNSPKTLHLPEMPKCLESRDKSRASQQFAKEGGRPAPNLSCKNTIQKQVL